MNLNSLLFCMMLGLSSCARAQSTAKTIPIPFTLKEAGFVTLVIENKDGQRVRNLVSDTWFKAGRNIAYWDGTDDLGRDAASAAKGIYKIPAKAVPAGTYTVRGLVHAQLNTSYEFAVYATGNPPWSTDDHTGAWLANHTPPQAALFVPALVSPTHQPAVFLGSYVTEGPDGLAWVDLEGKKMGGKKWVGGNWTAAPYLARDAGEKAASGIYAYVASVWETEKKSGQAELRITAISANADKSVIVYPIGALPGNTEDDMSAEIGGLAVNNGIAVVSLTKKNKLLFIDIQTGKLVNSVDLVAPMGLAFDAKGQLLALSGQTLVTFKSVNDVANLPAPVKVIAARLEAPVGLAIATDGKIYISDGGKSHQIKVFTAGGKFVQAIGKPGVPAAGPYDPLHMNNPAGITIDSRQQLWVTERDYLPKRVSVWSLSGSFIKAFYGPAKYGGGGTLDPQDKTRFYYAEEGRGTMEFKLDWKTGESKLERILYRRQANDLYLATRSGGPETPLYYKGKRYFTNAYNSSPTGGATTAFLFVERNGIAYPAVAMGSAGAWSELKTKALKTPPFFMWIDLNADAKVQDNEVTYQNGPVTGGITLMPDLSFAVSNLNGKAVQFSPSGFTAAGIPLYALDKGKVMATGVMAPASSGGNQMLTAPDGLAVVTQGIAPFDRLSLSGTKNGLPAWSYPNLWPGLHAAHQAPLPEFPGELIGPTRLLGGLINGGKDSGPLFAINSNHGMVYLFTADGLFVSTLFKPMRDGKRWNMPVAKRGMNLNDYSLAEENFWPTITQTTDGEVYLVDGYRSSLVHVTGLGSVERLPLTSVTVSDQTLSQLKADQTRQSAATAQVKSEIGAGDVLHAAISSSPMAVDGKLNDWSGLKWVDISSGKTSAVTGAITISGNRLYAGYRTGDVGLLKNSGEMPLAPFKTGGALDLMIATEAVDVRLLVTIINGKPKALIYKNLLKGASEGEKVPFSSPSRTIKFDRVVDISSQLQFAAGKNGDYEISVPLAVLNLKPTEGMMIKGDIGILKGDGAQTLSRIYWSNKSTSIVSDVPSEAELTPKLWGNWLFEQKK